MDHLDRMELDTERFKDTQLDTERFTNTELDSARHTQHERVRMRFDTKVAVLLRDDLHTWQRLNVCAFLTSGVAAAYPQIIGAPYADADGTPYLAMFRQPVLVFQGTAALLKQAHQRALGRDIPVSVFTSDLFKTGNDVDNRAAVRAVHRDDLDIVGIALHGPKNAVDKILKGATMHP